jgi:hypothetical protein
MDSIDKRKYISTRVFMKVLVIFFYLDNNHVCRRTILTFIQHYFIGEICIAIHRNILVNRPYQIADCLTFKFYFKWPPITDVMSIINKLSHHKVLFIAYYIIPINHSENNYQFLSIEFKFNRLNRELAC